MSSSGEAAAIVELYEAQFTIQYIVIAITALLWQDVLLCLGAEIRFIWLGRPTSLASVLYFFNRYILPLSYVLSLATISPVSSNSCTSLYWSEEALELLARLGPAVFTALRAFALSGSKLLCGIALILGLAPFLQSLVDMGDHVSSLSCADMISSLSSDHRGRFSSGPREPSTTGELYIRCGVLN
ncbi:hypothetical protein OH77DRAFT_1430149 [Trametes cingulata]|nr:hypothetical protein OH77DRAFT_1430149 [Trametes cingulata]